MVSQRPCSSHRCRCGHQWLMQMQLSSGCWPQRDPQAASPVSPVPSSINPWGLVHTVYKQNP